MNKELHDELVLRRMEFSKTPLHIPAIPELPNSDNTSCFYGAADGQLDMWVRVTYHPQIVQYRSKDTNDIVKYLKVFNTFPKLFPKHFKDPKVSMGIVYECAELFTYRFMEDMGIRDALKALGPRLHGIDSRDQVAEMLDNANFYIDAMLLKKYKSITNFSDRLYQFIMENR